MASLFASAQQSQDLAPFLRIGNYGTLRCGSNSAAQMLATGYARITQQAARTQSASRALASEQLAATANSIVTPGTTAHNAWMRAATETGWPAAHATEAAQNLLAPMTKRALEHWREGCIPQLRTHLPRPLSPALLVLAGNTIVSGIESTMTTLLAGCAVMVRCSSQDVHFPIAFLEALEAAAPDMAARVAVGWWPQDDSTAWQQAAQSARVIAAAGSDESLAAIAKFCDTSNRFITYGHRVSFAVVHEIPATARQQQELAMEIAYSVLLYDQAGCLSPRSIFFIEEAPAVFEYCQVIAKAMRQESQRLPRRQHTLDEKAAIARYLDAIRLHQAFTDAKDSARIYSKNSESFVLACTDVAHYTLPPALRIADIRYASSLSRIHAELRRFRPRVATIGSSHPKEIPLPFVAELGGYRVCPIGEMQRPPVGWGHEGRQPLADFTQWVEYEL